MRPPEHVLGALDSRLNQVLLRVGRRVQDDVAGAVEHKVGALDHVVKAVGLEQVRLHQGELAGQRAPQGDEGPRLALVLHVGDRPPHMVALGQQLRAMCAPQACERQRWPGAPACGAEHGTHLVDDFASQVAGGASDHGCVGHETSLQGSAGLRAQGSGPAPQYCGVRGVPLVHLALSDPATTLLPALCTAAALPGCHSPALGRTDCHSHSAGAGSGGGASLVGPAAGRLSASGCSEPAAQARHSAQRIGAWPIPPSAPATALPAPAMAAGQPMPAVQMRSCAGVLAPAASAEEAQRAGRRWAWAVQRAS